MQLQMMNHYDDWAGYFGTVQGEPADLIWEAVGTQKMLLFATTKTGKAHDLGKVRQILRMQEIPYDFNRNSITIKSDETPILILFAWDEGFPYMDYNKDRVLYSEYFIGE